MILTPRQKKIIDILTLENNYITVDELASRIGFSQRTIHYELQELLVFENQFKVKKKRGVGIKIVWAGDNKELFDFNKIQDKDMSRMKNIFKGLLLEEEVVSISTLSEEYYVSPTSIINDFKLIKEKFVKSGTCSLMSNSKGTYLEGSERQWQRTMLLFNDYILNEIVYLTGTRSFAQELNQYYGEENVEPVYELISNLHKYNLYSVAPHYEMNILSVLVVMVSRLKAGKNIMFTEEILKLDEVLAMKYYLIAKDILEKLSKSMIFDYKEPDIVSLSIYLQANRLEFSPNRDFVDEKYSLATHNMIETLSITVNEDLNHDKQLYKDVLVHLYHMVYRMKNEIYIKNPLLEQIKTDFRLMYDLVWLVLSQEKEFLEIDFTDDELGFLMLHFQSALDRTEKSRRILVVCPNGVVSSSFVMDRLQGNLPPLDIIELTSLSKVKHVNTEKVDLIISTIPLNNIKNNTVIISPLVTDEDLKNIDIGYRNIEKIKRSKNISGPNKISKYMDKDLIFIEDEKRQPQEIIRHVTKVLENKDYVEKEYYQSVLDREKQGSTELTSRSAVPHGSIEFVKETVIPIYVNKKGVKWGDSLVNLVLFFVISKKQLPEAKELLQEVFRIVKSDVVLDKRLTKMSESEIYSLFIGGKI